MTERISHWIGGSLQESPSDPTLPVFKPSTGEPIATVQLATPQTVGAAVGNAKITATVWRRTSLSRRPAVLFAVRQLLHDNADEHAKIVTAEHDKVLSDAYGETAPGPQNVELTCGIRS